MKNKKTIAFILAGTIMAAALIFILVPEKKPEDISQKDPRDKGTEIQEPKDAMDKLEEAIRKALKR